MNRGPDAPFGNAPSTTQRSAQHAGHGHTAPSCAQGPFTTQDASHIQQFSSPFQEKSPVLSPGGVLPLLCPWVKGALFACPDPRRKHTKLQQAVLKPSTQPQHSQLCPGTRFTVLGGALQVAATPKTSPKVTPRS